MTLHPTCARIGRALCFCLLSLLLSIPAQASEIWVAPTLQSDFGGLGVASGGLWPVTPVGAVRLAWAIPNDLQAFQSARVVLIPEAAAGGSTLTLYICHAQHSDQVLAACTGPFNHAFTAAANQLTEVNISATVAPRVGAPGARYLSILAFTTPTTSTDRIVGLRFAYSAAFVGDGAGVTNVNANLIDGLDSTAFAPAGHGHDVSQISNAARVNGLNVFTATQVISNGNLDLDNTTAAPSGIVHKNNRPFLHNFGTNNTFLGDIAGNLSLTGIENTVVGARALRSNTSGRDNNAFGFSALQNNTTGSINTAIGDFALNFNTTGGFNVAIGGSALASNVGGAANTATGVLALGDNTGGFENSAYGTDALRFNTTGFRNTAIGTGALRSNDTGEHNTAIGWQALNATTVGDGNAAVGRDALLANVNGNRNTGLGARTDVASPALNNATAIGFGAIVDASNKIRLGDTAVTLVETAGDLRVGAGGTIGCVQDGDGTVLAGACLSDERLKRDVASFGALLDKVVRLDPVRFRWKSEEYPDLQLGSAPSFGLIAQAAEQVLPELVAEDPRGFKVVRYHLLPLMLLKAVKEQQAIIERQQTENVALRERLDRLERAVDRVLPRQ